MELRSTFKLYDCTIIYFDMYDTLYVCDKHTPEAHLEYYEDSPLQVEQLYNNLYLIYYKNNKNTIQWIKLLSKVHHNI